MVRCQGTYNPKKWLLKRFQNTQDKTIQEALNDIVL